MAAGTWLSVILGTKRQKTEILTVYPTFSIMPNVSRQPEIKMAAAKPEIRCNFGRERDIREIPMATPTPALFDHAQFNCITTNISVHSGHVHLCAFLILFTSLFWFYYSLVISLYVKNVFGQCRTIPSQSRRLSVIYPLEVWPRKHEWCSRWNLVAITYGSWDIRLFPTRIR